jgi:dynein heavy chain
LEWLFLGRRKLHNAYSDVLVFIAGGQVCDAQSQFSSKQKLPSFGGAQGLEITKSLVDAQETFKKLVAELRSLSYNLLDVKVTRWHNDYHKFKARTVDLEVS